MKAVTVTVNEEDGSKTDYTDFALIALEKGNAQGRTILVADGKQNIYNLSYQVALASRKMIMSLPVKVVRDIFERTNTEINKIRKEQELKERKD
jgi:hypothetical protein